jgi:hypothetical protein
MPSLVNIAYYCCIESMRPGENNALGVNSICPLTESALWAQWKNETYSELVHALLETRSAIQ